MYVDVLKYGGAAATQTSAILYLKLNSGASDFTQRQVQGNAPFGGVTGAHWRFRERFAVEYGGSTTQNYQWDNVEFVKATDSEWLCRLQQDQSLAEKWWYRGSSHTATFGTGAGQFDLTTTTNDYIRAFVTTLCNQADVERLALSHLQGRIRFSETQAHDEVTNTVMSVDDLWVIIYRVSSMFQGMLGRHFATPLRLGTDGDRQIVADYAAKDVLIQIFNRMGLIGATRGVVELISEWRKSIDNFLLKPDGLDAETRRMVGGSFRVERA